MYIAHRNMKTPIEETAPPPSIKIYGILALLKVESIKQISKKNPDSGHQNNRTELYEGWTNMGIAQICERFVQFFGEQDKYSDGKNL